MHIKLMRGSLKAMCLHIHLIDSLYKEEKTVKLNIMKKIRKGKNIFKQINIEIIIFKYFFYIFSKNCCSLKKSLY